MKFSMKKKSLKKIFFCIFLVLTFSNCNDKEKNREKKQEVVFVLENVANIGFEFIKNFENYSKSEIGFKGLDTIKIDLKQPTLIIIGSMETEKDSLLCMPGDTIFINNINNKFIYNANKLSIYKQDLISENIDSLRKIIFKNHYEYSMTVFSDNIKSTIFPTEVFDIVHDESFIKNLIDKYQENYQKAFSSINTEKEFYKVRLNLLKNEIYKDLNIIYNKNNSKLINEFLSSDFFMNNTYCEGLDEFTFFRNYIRRNYRNNFNNVFEESEELFSAKNAKKIKMVCIFEMIDSKTSFHEISDFLNVFNKQYNDKNFYQFVDDKFLISLRANTKNIESVNIINSQKGKVFFNDIISKNETIYLDFWASWCAPCRAAMPASKEIQEKYNDRNVKFLYISVDKDYNAWQKANNVENLSFQNSFLEINYPKGLFYVENQIKTIPRYMIFHKGKLVNNNAPGPESPQLEIELNKYVSE
jgi:thiol-disulfide isomerase/thioredoxin